MACAEKLHMADAHAYAMQVLENPHATNGGNSMKRRLDLLDAVREEFSLGHAKEIDPVLRKFFYVGK